MPISSSWKIQFGNCTTCLWTWQCWSRARLVTPQKRHVFAINLQILLLFTYSFPPFVASYHTFFIFVFYSDESMNYLYEIIANKYFMVYGVMQWPRVGSKFKFAQILLNAVLKPVLTHTTIYAETAHRSAKMLQNLLYRRVLCIC